MEETFRRRLPSMTTITPDEMKSLETLFMSETGTPSILLMEHAAQGVAAAVSRHAPKSARVLFLCGPGNNGGDGGSGAQAAVRQTCGK